VRVEGSLHRVVTGSGTVGEISCRALLIDRGSCRQAMDVPSPAFTGRASLYYGAALTKALHLGRGRPTSSAGELGRPGGSVRRAVRAEVIILCRVGGLGPRG